MTLKSIIIVRSDSFQCVTPYIFLNYLFSPLSFFLCLRKALTEKPLLWENKKMPHNSFLLLLMLLL